MSQTLLAMLGLAGAMVATVIDGRHSVSVASLALAAGLAPTAASVGGGPAVLILLSAAVATAVLGAIAAGAARHSRWVAGLDPLIPVVSPGHHLFGPRSIRVAAAVMAIPAASWVALNLPIGEPAVVEGLGFPVAYAWLCGAARLILARTLEDLAVAASMVSLAGSAAWVLQSRPDSLVEAGWVAALAPCAGLTAGWLSGRHARRAGNP